MNQLEYVWLSNIDISNENKFQLIKMFGGISELYRASLDDLIDFGVKEKVAYPILNKVTKEKALKDLEYMQKNQIEVISFEDKNYPQKFQNIKEKPVCFYVKGNSKILNQETIGIVGSRLALNESLEISKLLANAFANQGIHVVSGLAKGIDKFAHLGALDGNGKRENDRCSCLSD